MIEILPNSHGNVLGIKASGKLTAEDYEEILIPRLESMLQENETGRFLYYISKDLEGIEPGAMWDDAKFICTHRDKFDRVAIVSDAKWVEWSGRLANHFITAEVKTFHGEQIDDAWQWVEA